MGPKFKQWPPTPVLLPGKSHGWRSLVGSSPWVAKSQTWLSDFTLTFHFHALEKEMATHSSVLAWRILGTGEPGGLPSMGYHTVRHDWSDLAVAAASSSTGVFIRGKTRDWWWTGRPGMLQFMGSQRVGHDWATELNWILLSSVRFSSVGQSCLTFCNLMVCSTPGFPFHHQLLELAQTHVHWVGDAIQPSHPLSYPSPPPFNLSQHQGLSKWVSS